MSEDENKIQDEEIKTGEVVLPEVAPEVSEKLKSEKISGRQETAPVEPEVESIPETPVSVADDLALLIRARAKIQERKRKKMDKIMALFEAKQRITNKDIRKLLHARKRTATNYLNILEQERRIIQVGKKGRGVRYGRISPQRILPVSKINIINSTKYGSKI